MKTEGIKTETKGNCKKVTLEITVHKLTPKNNKVTKGNAYLVVYMDNNIKPEFGDIFLLDTNNNEDAIFSSVKMVEDVLKIGD